jgi:uncharacterized protein
MTKMTSYPPGTPFWSDMATPDIEAAAAFYGDLLGWQVVEGPRAAEVGGYRRAESDGDEVAGMLPLMAEGQPSAWVTHIAVADIEATLDLVKENGGGVISEPMDVMGWLTFAIVSDPTGAVFGVTQPAEFNGAERVNDAGSMVWNELNTRDPEGAKAFYGAVFGWEANEMKMERPAGVSGPEVYVEWKRAGDGHSVGGMMDITGMVPEEVPAHWLTYFGVDDTDAAVEKVKAAGGDVMFGPVDIPAGRFAIVTDPVGGASFAVIKLPE